MDLDQELIGSIIRGGRDAFVHLMDSGLSPEEHLYGDGKKAYEYLVAHWKEYGELASLEAVQQNIGTSLEFRLEDTHRFFLDEVFNDVFRILDAMTKVLTGFAVMALSLSMIGLFGLAAFMAARRTKEIGIRKVMGASLGQIVRMLIWQFSIPVIWALLIAPPISYFAANTYLAFFADRLDMTGLVVAGAGVLAVVVSWTVVAVHAVQIARSSPIDPGEPSSPLRRSRTPELGRRGRHFSCT